MAEGSSVQIPVRVTMDDSQAKTELTTMSSGFSHLETSIISTSRRAVSGFSGMLSSVNDVYNSQQRLNIANINYTLTVRTYGESSIQATRALDQLKVAQNGVSLAQERLSLRYVQFAISVGPALYSMVMRMVAASAGMTVQNYMETASWYAKAAAIGLTLGLLTGGILVVSALASGALVNQQITQNNQFYGQGQASPQASADYANQSIVDQLGSMGTP